MSRDDSGEHVDLNGFMEGVKRRNPGQTEFIQAVQEVAEDIFEFIGDKEDYHRWQILRRIAEPDRVMSFRVCWEDDKHNIRVQRGYRVQNNNAIGPPVACPARLGCRYGREPRDLTGLMPSPRRLA